MTGWISRFREDVYTQAESLQGLKLPGFRSIRNGLFVGSGDSYTCALLMEYLSKHNMLACHPSDILNCPQMLLDHEVLFISASGKTRSNIEAAKLARKFGIKSTAIVAHSQSALEKVCTDTLNLGYLFDTKSSSTGILEFTGTVIICMSLIGIEINLKILGPIMSDAHKQVSSYNVDLPTSSNSILFLGSGISYPLASYAALKMHELFGFRSFGYLLDDYYHSPIFSLKKPDSVFVLDIEKMRKSMSANFYNKLKKIHSHSYYFQPQVGRSTFERIMFFVFIIQILSLTISEEMKKDKPYYQSKKNILQLSSSLIY